MKYKKGFTLIELLSVIIILGVLLIIAVPNISNMIQDSKARTYLDAAKVYVNAVRNKVVNHDYVFNDKNTTYYVAIQNIEVEKGGKSPFGSWLDAYVVVAYDGKNYSYHWTSVDSSGYKVVLEQIDGLTVDDVFYDSSLTVNTNLAVGTRTKIHLIDKNGNIINKLASIELSRAEARKCYSYRKISNKIMIDNYYSSCSKDVYIPTKIEGLPVTDLYNWSFYNLSLTSVLLPNTLITIGSSAFKNNYLTDIIIPGSVTTIGSEAFANNRFTSITLPTTVTSLGGGAFSANLISEENAFIYKQNTDGTKDYTTLLGYAGMQRSTLNIPATANGVALKVIGSAAFRGMGFSAITIPDTVTIINDWAFSSNNLTSITLPSGLQSIGYAAFSNNKLASISIPATVTSIGGRSFNANQLPSNQAFIYKRTSGGIDYSTIVSYGGGARTNLTIPTTASGINLTTLDNASFFGCGLTGSITIPSTVTNIISNALNVNSLADASAFIYKRTSSGIDYSTIVGYGGANRTNVIVPATANGVALRTIATSAFNENSITNIVLPEGLTTIENNAFMCNKLTSVIIPSTVTSIGTNAFRKEITWGLFNQITNIVNKTGRSFNWQNIVGSSYPADFITGTIEHDLGNIEVVNQ